MTTRRELLKGSAGALALSATMAAAAVPALATVPASEPEITPALLQAYSEWLFMERRLLAIEMYPRYANPDRWVPVNTAACWFHFPLDRDWRDVPKPSTRAAAVLGAVGIDWTTDRDPLPCSHGTIQAARACLHPDAELIDLGHELDPLMAELKAIWPEYRRASNALEALRHEYKTEWLGLYAAGRDEEAAALGDRWERETGFDPVGKRVQELDHALEPIIDAIMETPARTIVGLGVKARAAVWGLLTLQEGLDEEPDDYRDQINRNLILAVLALTGGEALS